MGVKSIDAEFDGLYRAGTFGEVIDEIGRGM